jgi:glucosamine--fructose-6-phosphate aminotransferase (isomerizing)
MRRLKPLVEADDAPGEMFLSEIREQPAALMRLLEGMDEIEAVAKSIAADPPRLVRMAAHGSSDNAATYGVYAFGLLPGWTAVRDSISLSVYYDVELDPRDSLVIGLSQSGSTPDVVERLERARCGGARTLAITNAPESDLAAVADWVIPLSTGEERAVAATKTYMNELAALALLCASLAGQGAAMADDVTALAGALLPELIASLEHDVASTAGAFAFVGRMFVTGRGIEFATAREIALKLVETCRIAATALTPTDLAHGPVAAVDAFFPVWAIAPDDPGLAALADGAERARQAGATLVASGSAADRIEGAAYRFTTPQAPRPLLSPLLSIVPGQLFAWALAQAKGLDPDRPRHLSKVTTAR